MSPESRPAKRFVRKPITLALLAAVVLLLAAIALPLPAAVQHGQSESELDQLFEAVASHLELRDDQREEIGEPMRDLLRLLPEVQRLHVKVALDLNETQREALGKIVAAHVAVGGAHGGGNRHGAAGD